MSSNYSNQSYCMIDVIVTGASGFIGRALINRLKNTNLKILALDRSAGDIANAKTWLGLPQARFVVHLAGSSYVPDSWWQSAEFLINNVVATEYALNYCAHHDANLIFASSYIYGYPQTLPVNESHPVRPSNPYAYSKYMAEQLCKFSSEFRGISSVVFRFFNVFGPGQRSEFLIPTIVEQVMNESEINVVDLSPRRDYVYVSDAVNAIYLALNMTSGYHVFNIGYGKSYSVKDVIETAQILAGTSIPVVSLDQKRRQEIPDIVADIRHVRAVLGWNPVYSLYDGLSEIIKTDFTT